MGRFNEADHRRNADGRFASKPVLAAAPQAREAAVAAATTEGPKPQTTGLATLHEQRLEGLTFDGDVLDGDYAFCSFRKASLRRSDLAGRHVSSDFTGADLTGARIGSSVGNSYRQAALVGTVSCRAVHQDADFSDADLSGSTWASCSFWGADLSEARGITAARFHDCRYDTTTQFPAGYDPDRHGWVRADPPVGYMDAVARARGAAEAGDLTAA